MKTEEAQGLGAAMAPRLRRMAPSKEMCRQEHKPLMAPFFYLALPRSRTGLTLTGA
jgi:hypothetical protein|tara:strand:- start:2107 stop:2274 length:168 start_codon:yes stop_codon:yes gene_type:complete